MVRFALVLATVVAGAATGTGHRQGPPGCAASEFRQFDFWVGEWRVTSGGQVAGTNSVTLEEDRCLIHEHWKGARGGTGQSFNFYDQADHQWHQIWVAAAGGPLFLAGTYQDGQLRYVGERPAPDGGVVHHRLTFFQNADGTVRQLWETSTDQHTWQVAFDGLYTRQQP